MWKFLLLTLALSAELEEVEEYTYTGEFNKLYSVYVKVYLPSRPLHSLEIEINLSTEESDNEEYDEPHPKAYIGMQSNPEYEWDYFLNLDDQSASIIVTDAPESKFLIVRIDGGLATSFTITAGYGIPKWTYDIKVKCSYCLSGYFLAGPSNLCEIPVIEEGESVDGKFGAVLTIPEGTEKLILKGMNLTANPRNFQRDSIGTDDIEILWPEAGRWYLVGDGSFTYETQSCQWDDDGKMWCNGKTVEFIEEVKHYTSTPDQVYTNYNADVLVFRVREEDIKYMYKVDGDEGYTLGYRTVNQSENLPYLKVGRHYLTLSSSNSSINLYKVTTDDSLCNGEDYKLNSHLIYTCDCSKHLTGRHCAGKSISDNMYYLGLTVLVLSNLAMIPAIITGILYSFFGEVLIFTCNMVASIVYHICDYHYYCVIDDYSYLRTQDFILSYLSVLIIFVDLLRIQRKDHKLFLFCVLFILVLIIGTGSGFEGFVRELLVKNI